MSYKSNHDKSISMMFVKVQPFKINEKTSTSTLYFCSLFCILSKINNFFRFFNMEKNILKFSRFFNDFFKKINLFEKKKNNQQKSFGNQTYKIVSVNITYIFHKIIVSERYYIKSN